MHDVLVALCGLTPHIRGLCGSTANHLEVAR